MARKKALRQLRTGTVINATSKEQEKTVIKALNRVVADLGTTHGVQLTHDKRWVLSDIIQELKTHFPDVEFHCTFETSYMAPDGGILRLVDADGDAYPILISEVKNQGTNDLRKAEGKKKQSKGNAIERLGKNVIGFRAAMLNENIFPFVCFGYGCDFAPDSSILDRVVTINMFGKLCVTNVHDQGPNGLFDRGSYYFREAEWSVDEMYEVMFDIAEKSMFYYFSKLGKARFLR